MIYILTYSGAATCAALPAVVQYVTTCVKRNMHNLCCTTYSLLRERQLSRAAAQGGGQGGGSASSEASLDKSAASTHPHRCPCSRAPALVPSRICARDEAGFQRCDGV